jgi:hypothetical protein
MKARLTLLLFVLALLVVGNGLQLFAQDTKGKAVKAADPHIGAWKLNIAKSNIPANVAPKEETYVIRELGDQYEATITGIQTDGKPISQKIIWPKQGGTMQLQPAPTEGVSTVVTVISLVNLYNTTLQNGKQVGVIHVVINQDGKTFTMTNKGMDPTGQRYEGQFMFEKQ